MPLDTTSGADEADYTGTSMFLVGVPCARARHRSPRLRVPTRRAEADSPAGGARRRRFAVEPDRSPVGVTTTLRLGLDVGPSATFDVTAATIAASSQGLTGERRTRSERRLRHRGRRPPAGHDADGTRCVTVVATVREAAAVQQRDGRSRRASNPAPSCDAAVPDITEISPPNDSFVPVTISGVTDPDGDPSASSSTRSDRMSSRNSSNRAAPVAMRAASGRAAVAGRQTRRQR